MHLVGYLYEDGTHNNAHCAARKVTSDMERLTLTEYEHSMQLAVVHPQKRETS